MAESAGIFDSSQTSLRGKKLSPHSCLAIFKHSNHEVHFKCSLPAENPAATLVRSSLFRPQSSPACPPSAIKGKCRNAQLPSCPLYNKEASASKSFSMLNRQGQLSFGVANHLQLFHPRFGYPDLSLLRTEKSIRSPKGARASSGLQDGKQIFGLKRAGALQGGAVGPVEQRGRPKLEPLSQFIYHKNMRTSSPVIVWLVFCLVACVQSVHCPPGQFREQDGCIPCASVPHAHAYQNLAAGECRCSDGYEWSFNTGRCLATQTVPRRLQDCDATSQYTSTKDGTPSCKDCPAAGAGYLDGGTGTECNCDTTNSFAWSATLEACVCSAAFYLKEDGTCSACPTDVDVGAVTDESIDGTCTCKTADKFAWNAADGKCACNINFYMDADNVCNACPTGWNIGTDSTIDGTCTCSDVANLVWSTSDCKCEKGFYTDGQTCATCPTSDPADETDDGTCPCPTDSEWSATSKICLCNVGFYFDTDKCTGCPIDMEGIAETDLLADGKCTCKTADNYDWDSTANACKCKPNYFSKDAACTKCSQGPAYLPDTTTDGACTCNTDNKFEWSATGFVCACGATFYLKNNACAACPTGALYAADDTTIDGACDCSADITELVWNPTAFECTCKANFFFDTDKCTGCPEVGSGVLEDTTDDGLCNCDTANNFIWAAPSCLCNKNFFLDTDKCVACGSGVGYKEDTVVDGKCVCDTDNKFDWSDTLKKCACQATFYLDGTACKTCPKTPGYVDPDASIDGACDCDTAIDGLVWSESLKVCGCKAGTFLDTVDTTSTCKDCPKVGVGVLADTTDDGLCNCDTANNFKWDPTNQNCFCDKNYFLDGNVCAACPTSIGVLPDDTIDGQCTCDTTNEFQWNTNLKNCLCKSPKFYDGTACTACPTNTPGYLPDSTDDGICTCDEPNRYKWEVSLNECGCLQGFFATADNKCKLCPTGPGYISDPLPDGQCTCDDSKNYAWDSVTTACICKVNYFLSASKICTACPSTAAGYGESTTANDQCQCLTENNFFWDAATKTCKCKPGFAVSDGVCVCAAGTYINALGNCNACAGMAGLFLPVTSVDNKCKCDTAKKFLWDDDLKRCVCETPFYQTANGTCATCVGLAGAATPGSSTYGACACNAANNFEWSTSSRSCVCRATYFKNGTGCSSCGGKKTGECLCDATKFQQYFGSACICISGYYKKKDGNCSLCDMDGVSWDGSSTNLGCNCDTSLNYAWSNVSLSCVCKSGSILDASGICISCASIPGATNTSNSTTACICKPNFLWIASTQACVCAINYYLTAAQACAACSALPGYAPAVPTDSVPAGQCKCTASYEWSPKTASCICKSGSYLSNKTCLSCSLLTGFLSPATSDGVQCECDPTKFFIWNSAQLKCVCLSGYYLKGSLCFSCEDMTGYNPSAAATLNNCTCDTVGLFVWNSTLTKCVCQVGNFLADGACKACKTLAGSAANASSVDGKCFCNTTRFFSWNVTANKCACNATSYINAAGNCNTCANITATPLDGVTCSCPSDREWADFACLCNLGTYYDNTTSACAKCEDQIGGSSDTPSGPGRCVCDPNTGFIWSVAAGKCVCGNSTYLSETNECVSCKDVPNVATPPSSVNGRCSCKQGYSWNDNLRSCICQPGSYLNKLGNCSTCKGMVGTETAGGSNQAQECLCNATLNFKWDFDSKTCICAADYFFKEATKTCGSCSSVGGTKPGSEDGKTCVCAEGMEWVPTLLACKCGAKFYPTIATAEVEAVCAACSSLAGTATSGASNGIACECNSTLKLEWSYDKAECLCKSGLYTNAQGGCSPCSGTGNLGTSKNGECLCNEKTNFVWDLLTRSCICINQYYLNGTICAACSALPGVVTTGETDGTSCECLKPTVWNSPLKACVCKAGEYVKKDNTCGNCSLVAKSSPTSNLIFCNCLAGYGWSNFLCLCKNGTFKSANGVCSPCSSVAGALNSSTAEVCNCNKTAGFTWEATKFKCICNTSAFISGNACKSCTTITTSTGVSDGTKCTCKAAFSWNVNLATCACTTTTYLALDGTCKGCAGLPGVSTPATNGLICTCNAIGKFTWNTTTASCVCLANFYLNSAKSCQTCATKSNTNSSAKAVPNTCGCKTGYKWTAITSSCSK